MQSKHQNIRERALKIAQEVKSFQEAFERFESKFETIWPKPIRLMLVEEVAKILQDLDASLQFEEFMADRDEEVWISTYFVQSASNDFQAVRQKKERQWAWTLADNLRKNRELIMIPLDDFKNLIQELKVSILDGKIDKNIHLRAHQLIYDKMIVILNENTKNKRF